MVNEKNIAYLPESYNQKTGRIYVVELDGYFTKEKARDQIKLLSGCGFRAHTTEV